MSFVWMEIEESSKRSLGMPEGEREGRETPRKNSWNYRRRILESLNNRHVVGRGRGAGDGQPIGRRGTSLYEKGL